MDFRDLTYFITVAREQNISRASEKLFVSQPALSETIARLEKRVGCALFLRQQHGLMLTKEGEAFAETARKIIQIKDEMEEEIHTVTRGYSGRIRLGISHLFSGVLLPKALPEFRIQRPNVEIVVNNQTSSVLERMLMDDELDVVIMVESKPNEQLVLQVLFYEQILLAVSPQNPIAALGVPDPGEDYPFLSPELLQGQLFILSQEKMRLRESAEAFFAAENISYKTGIITASVETANRLAAYNSGIAFIPAIYAETIDTSPKPSYFTTGDSLKDWTVAIGWRKKHKQDQLLQDFARIFKESI
ncbi:LysR family transcriptional regulator [Spirochaetia bacterium]|nr:LysR family transcriptional regulator [Spirochaetia bacterium]